MTSLVSGKSREEIAEAYKSEPWWYDVRGFFILTLAYRSTLGHQMRFFGPNFGPKHLELACGTGTLLDFVLGWRRRRAMPGVEITAVDYAESMLAGARHRFRDATNMCFVHADAADMPFAEATFDTANIANAVHCLPDVDGALRGMYRVLKPGATLAANVLLYPRGFAPLRHIAEAINAWGKRKGILYTPYERDEIRERFLTAGFQVASEAVDGNCYDILVRKPA